MSSKEQNGRQFDLDVLMAYAVPESPGGLENRVIKEMLHQMPTSQPKTTANRRPWIAVSACLAAVAAVVLVVVIAWPGEKIAGEIRVERVSIPSTIRISDRAVAMVEPGTELGYQVADDGSVHVLQRLGVSQKVWDKMLDEGLPFIPVGHTRWVTGQDLIQHLRKNSQTKLAEAQ